MDSALGFYFLGGSSVLLCIFLGVVLGNVVRGVPLDATGYFFEPLWTNFRLGEHTGILDWYTVLVGVQALLVLMMHGSLWVQLKNNRPGQRARRKITAGLLWWGVLILTALVTAITFSVQPQVAANFKTWPLGYILPLLCYFLPDSLECKSNCAARISSMRSWLRAHIFSGC